MIRRFTPTFDPVINELHYPMMTLTSTIFVAKSSSIVGAKWFMNAAVVHASFCRNHVSETLNEKCLLLLLLIGTRLSKFFVLFKHLLYFLFWHVASMFLYNTNYF